MGSCALLTAWMPVPMSSKRRLTRSEIQHIYSTRTEGYNSFISVFRYPQGIRAILQASALLRPGLRVLDAGCGFGVYRLRFLKQWSAEI